MRIRVELDIILRRSSFRTRVGVRLMAISFCCREEWQSNLFSKPIGC